jgi:hypothetical protein
MVVALRVEGAELRGLLRLCSWRNCQALPLGYATALWIEGGLLIPIGLYCWTVIMCQLEISDGGGEQWDGPWCWKISNCWREAREWKHVS